MHSPEEILHELDFEAPGVVNWCTTLGIGTVEAESLEALICNITTVNDKGEVSHFQQTLQKDSPQVIQEHIKGVSRGYVIWCQTETSLSSDTKDETGFFTNLYYVSE